MQQPGHRDIFWSFRRTSEKDVPLSSYNLLRVGSNESVKGHGHLARSFGKNNLKRDKGVTKIEDGKKRKTCYKASVVFSVTRELEQLIRY